MILTPLQKLPKNVGDLGKMIVAMGFEKLPKVQQITQSGHTDSNNTVPSLPDRPESRLTVTSECSSTISSEDDNAQVTHIEDSRATLQQPMKKKESESDTTLRQSDVEIPPTSPTGSSISDDLNWPAPPPPLTSIEPTEPTKTTPSPAKSNNRLSNLFSNMKIPKLKLNRKQNSGGSSKSGSPASSDEVDKMSPVKTSPTQRSENGDSKTSKNGRSMSVGSDDGANLFVRGSGERHSYRAPTAPSRYMQAAEAYAAKKRSDR